MKKVLITGVSGYIGSNLVKKFLEVNIEVHAIVPPDISYEYIDNIKEEIHFHVYDGSTESVFNAVKRSNPDVVFHLASLFLSEHKSADISNLINSNVLLGTQLLEAMSKNGIKNLVNTGTSWQHYQNEDYNPVNIYAATKQAFEDILKYYTEAGFLSAISLHLFDTCGPGDNRPKLFKLLSNAAQSNEILNMSPGDQLLDLVYIDDVVNAFLVAADMLLTNESINNEIFFVSTGNPISLKKLVELYMNIFKKNVCINWGGRSYRRREVMTPSTNYENLSGWNPDLDIEDALKKMSDI